ncbi:MAG: hypothetical protein ACXWN9_06890, partial [Candidatus Binataceae bacterium]
MRPTLLRLIVIGAALAFAACSMRHRGKPDNSSAAGGPSAEASSEASAEASPSAETSPSETAPADAAPAEGGAGDAASSAPGAT